MRKIKLRTSLGALALTALLAGCSDGGSNDDGGGGGGMTPPPTSSTDLPASALENTNGLVAYVRQLIGSNSDTAEPVRIGDVTLPVSDTTEPAN